MLNIGVSTSIEVKLWTVKFRSRVGLENGIMKADY